MYQAEHGLSVEDYLTLLLVNLEEQQVVMDTSKDVMLLVLGTYFARPHVNIVGCVYWSRTRNQIMIDRTLADDSKSRSTRTAVPLL